MFVLTQRVTPVLLAAVVTKVVASASARRSDRVLKAIYEATRVSPMLTHAMAMAYPFTFCAHKCLLPIGHEGDHHPDAFATTGEVL